MYSANRFIWKLYYSGRYNSGAVIGSFVGPPVSKFIVYIQYDMLL